MFQPEDEKELAEKFSDKHRKTVLKPQKKKNQELHLIINSLQFCLIDKNIVFSATYSSSNPSIFFTFILKGNSKERALKAHHLVSMRKLEHKSYCLILRKCVIIIDFI